MEIDFQETEMSKRAKNILENLVSEGQISPDSQLGKEIKYNLKYNPKIIEQFSNKKGLDIKKIYSKTILPFDEERVLLLRRCVEFNLTEEETHEVIKERYRLYKNDANPEFGLTATKKYYPEWCKDYGITPDPNFPDW